SHVHLPLKVLCSGRGSAEDGEDVVFLHHQVLGAVELHLGAGVLAEQHLVAGLDLGRAQRTVVQRLALADRDHFALDRLLGGGVGDDDAARGHLFLFHALDDDAVVKRLDIHCRPRKYLIVRDLLDNEGRDVSSRPWRVPASRQENARQAGLQGKWGDVRGIQVPAGKKKSAHPRGGCALRGPTESGPAAQSAGSRLPVARPGSGATSMSWPAAWTG